MPLLSSLTMDHRVWSHYVTMDHIVYISIEPLNNQEPLSIYKLRVTKKVTKNHRVCTSLESINTKDNRVCLAQSQ